MDFMLSPHSNQYLIWRQYPIYYRFNVLENNQYCIPYNASFWRSETTNDFQLIENIYVK